MRILFLHKYDRQAAGFRYRLEQYLPALEKAGVQWEISSLLDDRYLVNRFETGKIRALSVRDALFRRLGALSRAHRFDAVVIYSEILPYFPALFEHYLSWRRIPFIVDYDDAIFHNYDLSENGLFRALMGGKIREVMRLASAVFAGNEYLASYARGVNRNVQIFPTVVDLGRYREVRRYGAGGSFTLGWIGSPSTAQYLKTVAPALHRFTARPGVRVVLVGAGKISLPGVSVESRPWSEEREIRDIMEFDVGIMPLTDDPWSRGKCGFKLIQYMACGVPAIASAVGVNAEIVRDGVSGLLAESEEDWERALDTLYENRHLLERMGRESRATVEERYSLELIAARFAQAIRETVECGG
jgi:glycosyltransferase involved in cell wall biosynthesis